MSGMNEQAKAALEAALRNKVSETGFPAARGVEAVEHLEAAMEEMGGQGSLTGADRVAHAEKHLDVLVKLKELGLVDDEGREVE